MRPLVIVLVLLAGSVYSNMALIETSNNIGLSETPVHIRAINKRAIDKNENSAENFYSFLEEKLMHQNQALEHLITSVDNSADMIKKLIDTLSKGLEKPKMPTKAEPEKVSKQKFVRANDNPIVKLGKNIPKYGKLAKDLLMKEVVSSTDPTPIIEENPKSATPGFRRSLGDEATGGSDQLSDEHTVNPWCPIALLCQKTVDPVCGFDEEFGYGRFEDFCHLLRVNCYWKYNFSVVSSCQPKL